MSREARKMHPERRRQEQKDVRRAWGAGSHQDWDEALARKL